jgi:hypothetical protein
MLPIDPYFKRAASESRHPVNQVLRGETENPNRTDIYRPTFDQLKVGSRANAWFTSKPTSNSVTGIIVETDQPRQRVCLRIYIGGTKECRRWFRVSDIHTTWFFNR